MKHTPKILVEDENFIVIDKPSKMIVNNANSNKDEFTIQDWLSLNFPKTKSDIESGSEFSSRGGIVHRLDKETSGVLIVALNDECFSALQKQFKERVVKKTYLALVHGKLVDEGEINVPIGRLPWNRMRFGVIPQGRESFTKFKVLKHLSQKIGKKREELSLVEVYPQTGRTHQIRVHMQYAGHPIFGDSLYAGRRTYLEDKKLIDRHFLHASRISFISPSTKKEITVEAKLASELEDLLTQFQIS